MIFDKKPSIVEFQERGDERGYLVVAESNAEVPFDIKRVFYIYGTEENVARGEHANRLTEFMLIVVNGSCKVDVDDGNNVEMFELKHQNQGLYLPKMYWKTMYDFSPDCILLVLCSEKYNSEEYIRDYDEFIKEVKSYE